MNKSQHLFAIALFSLCSLSYADGIGSYSPESQTFVLDVNENLSSDDETISFGSENMIPIIGDWNGSTKDNVGLYDPATARFMLDYNENGQWDGISGGDKLVSFGGINHLPVIGDWDGDGKDNIGIYRPWTAWFILDINGNYQWDGLATDVIRGFGPLDQLPIAGDWNGNGIDTIGIYRPDRAWFVLDINGDYAWTNFDDDTMIAFGGLNQKPVTGDWNMNGVDTIGVYYAADQKYVLDVNGDGSWNGGEVDRVGFFTGDANQVPVAGDWSFQSEDLFYPPAGFNTVCSFDNDIGNLNDFSCTIKNFEDYGYGKLTDYTVNNSTIFIDYSSRKNDLALLSENDRDLLCDTGWLEDNMDYATYFYNAPAYSADGIEYPFNEGEGWGGLIDVYPALTYGVAHHKLLEIPDAGEMILRMLREYATRQTDLGPDFGYNNSHYHLGLGFIYFVKAWNAIKNDDFVSEDDRTLIDNYLESLSTILAIPQGIYDGNQNGLGYTDFTNHSWSAELSLMAYGISVGDNEFFQLGIARLFSVLDGIIRQDGSHVAESQRGAAALQYSINSTSYLIYIAELAATQGYDLYDAKINGVSLNDVISFHVDVLADNSLLNPYTEHLNGEFNDFNRQFCENESQCTYYQNYTKCDEINSDCFSYSVAWSAFEVFRTRRPSAATIDKYLNIFPDGDFLKVVGEHSIQSCEYRDIN